MLKFQAMSPDTSDDEQSNTYSDNKKKDESSSDSDSDSSSTGSSSSGSSDSDSSSSENGNINDGSKSPRSIPNSPERTNRFSNGDLADNDASEPQILESNNTTCCIYKELFQDCEY